MIYFILFIHYYFYYYNYNNYILPRAPLNSVNVLLLLFVIIIIIIIIIIITSGSVMPLTDETTEVSVCHSGHFRAKCAWDEVIVIANARYGRMRINKCVSENFGYVGCSVDVIDVLDRYCSGRRTCHIRVLDETFTETTPCHEDLNLYLQVDYQCVRGIQSFSEMFANERF